MTPSPDEMMSELPPTMKNLLLMYLTPPGANGSTFNGVQTEPSGEFHIPADPIITNIPFPYATPLRLASVKAGTALHPMPSADFIMTFPNPS